MEKLAIVQSANSGNEKLDGRKLGCLDTTEQFKYQVC